MPDASEPPPPPAAEADGGSPRDLAADLMALGSLLMAGYVGLFVVRRLWHAGVRRLERHVDAAAHRCLANRYPAMLDRIGQHYRQHPGAPAPPPVVAVEPAGEEEGDNAAAPPPLQRRSLLKRAEDAPNWSFAGPPVSGPRNSLPNLSFLSTSVVGGGGRIRGSISRWRAHMLPPASEPSPTPRGTTLRRVFSGTALLSGAASSSAPAPSLSTTAALGALAAHARAYAEIYRVPLLTEAELDALVTDATAAAARGHAWVSQTWLQARVRRAAARLYEGARRDTVDQFLRFMVAVQHLSLLAGGVGGEDNDEQQTDAAPVAVMTLAALRGSLTPPPQPESVKSAGC